MKNEKLITILLTLYIILFPIKVLVLPYIGNKLQLADGLFLVLLLITVIQLPQIKQIRLLNFDKAIIFWLLAHIITCLFHPTKASVIELVGTTYLVILYGCLNILFISKNKDEIRETFFHGFGLSALLLMFLGFLGTIGISFGYPNICVFKHDNYPYFGTVYRMSGLTTHPVMFASIAGICFLLIVTEFNIQKAIEVATWKKLAFVMLLIGLPFTFTKSVLIASVCALGIFVCKYSKTYRNLIIFTFPFVLLLFVFATHFVVVNKYVFDNQKETLFHALDKTSTQLSIGNNYIIKTSYAFLKEKGWFVFKQNPLVGIGSGNFNKVSFESDKSSYRDGYDPHSSITGSLAEMGIIGFSAFLSIFVLAFQRIVLFLKTDLSLSDRYLLYGFLGIFIFMFCEAIATDVMNFRHFWLIFAFFAAWTRKVSVSII